jgi:hypothetical protein
MMLMLSLSGFTATTSASAAVPASVSPVVMAMVELREARKSTGPT